MNNDMTWDAQKMVDLMKGLVTRSMARKIEEGNKGVVAMFEKSFQRLAWYELEG